MEQLCERISLSRNPVTTVPEACRNRPRLRRAAASPRFRLAGFDFQERAFERSRMVQIRKTPSLWPLRYLLRPQVTTSHSFDHPFHFPTRKERMHGKTEHA